MTKKDYIVIATKLGQKLREVRGGNTHGTIDNDENVLWDIVNDLSDVFELDNKRFNGSRFCVYIEKVANNNN